MMKLPNFLIVGSQKAGTTMLHNTLSKHPEIFMSTKKEINFFTRENYYSQGLLAYSKHFKSASENHKVIGESSPGYICFPGVAEKIRSDLGDIKIIILLRDPINRALSQYWDNRRQFDEPKEFSELTSHYLTYEDYQPGKRGYFSRGLYMNYIKEYLKHFSANNVKIIIFEELIKNPENILKSICEFLNIRFPSNFNQLSKEANSAVYYSNPIYRYFMQHPKKASKIPVNLRRFIKIGKKARFNYPLPNENTLNKLREFYKPQINELEKFIGRELEEWELAKGNTIIKNE